MVKHLPTMWETQVQSLGREDLLEKEMTTHSSILAWKIPWMEEPVGYSPWGLSRSKIYVETVILFSCDCTASVLSKTCIAKLFLNQTIHIFPSNFKFPAVSQQ